MKYDIFISYSRRDYPFVKQITNALDAGGFTYFIDQEGLFFGEDFASKIIEGIKNSELFLFISSESSNRSSTWCIKEVFFAFELKKTIVPIRIDNSEYNHSIKFHLLNFHSIDLFDINDESIIERIILKDVGQLLGKPKNETKLSVEERATNIEAARKRQFGPEDYQPQKINIDVFISYRRVDGSYIARNIMQGLKIMGYPKVFFDFNSLRDGVFNTQIIDAIYSCNDFILLISPLALKNCSREGDWVAKEIRLALKYNKKIIPVVIEDTFNGWPEDFPKDLSPIKEIHLHKLLMDEYFEDSINKLTARLITTASANKPDISELQDNINTGPSKIDTVFYKIKVDKKCRLFIDDEEIQILEASKLAKIPLSKGEYLCKVVDYNNENIFKESVVALNYDKVDLISL